MPLPPARVDSDPRQCLLGSALARMPFRRELGLAAAAAAEMVACELLLASDFEPVESERMLLVSKDYNKSD